MIDKVFYHWGEGVVQIPRAATCPLIRTTDNDYI